MVSEQDRLEERELLELARDTAERLKILTIKLEAYANVPADTGNRRRLTDRDEDGKRD